MTNADLGWYFTALSFFLIPAGIVSIVLSYVLYRVPSGHVMIRERAKHGRLLGGQWTMMFQHPGRVQVSLSKVTLRFPSASNPMEISTPDDGVIGVRVSLTYSPDGSHGLALQTFAGIAVDLEKILEARVLSALHSWATSKPLPGTLKRALSMKDQAEEFVRAKLTSMPVKESLVVHTDPTFYYRTGYPVRDLGICLHEVHIMEMTPLRNGTGRPDWGDGTEGLYSAEVIFNQFKSSAHNLSELEQLYNSLVARYPKESEDIRDIYFYFRSRMKEHR